MNKLKILLAIFLILGTFLSAIDGFGDFLLFSKNYIHRNDDKYGFLRLIPQHLDKKIYASYFDNTNDLEYMYLPYIGNIAHEGQYGIYNIDKSGRRLFSNAQKSTNFKSKNMLILGASQAFGYYSTSEQNLANKLANIFPDYNIDNYSSPGQKIGQNLLNWYRIENLQHRKYDVVIIVNGPTDYFNECRDLAWFRKNNNKELENYKLPALATIKNILANKFKSNNRNYYTPCVEHDYQKLVVNKITYDIKSILSYGREKGVDTYIFIPPTPWGNKSNSQNLKSAFSESDIKSFSEISDLLSLNLENMANVKNLNYIFDGTEQQYFLDTGAHLTPSGIDLLAKEIAKYINLSKIKIK